MDRLVTLLPTRSSWLGCNALCWPDSSC